jgi:hypothetical protein
MYKKILTAGSESATVVTGDTLTIMRFHSFTTRYPEMFDAPTKQNNSR